MKSVLIVDDSEPFRALLEYSLAGHYRVSSASTAAEAYNQICHHKPDAMILDIVMPGEMNGAELCEKIKADKHLRDIYIILSSADAEAALTNLNCSCHADDLLLKPYTPADVQLRMLEVDRR